MCLDTRTILDLISCPQAKDLEWWMNVSSQRDNKQIILIENTRGRSASEAEALKIS
jgi:hypothetical protein